VCGILSNPSSGTYNTSQHIKISFRCVIRIVLMFSSCWCDICLCWWFDLSQLNICSLKKKILSPPPKNTTWPSLLLMVFKLQSLFFWFLIFYIDHFIEVLFIFNFILQTQFTRYVILQFGSHFFFLIFFLAHFINVLLVFQFYP